MSQRRGLGRGLNALIPAEEPAEASAAAREILIDSILPNPRQPRTQFEPQALADLSASILKHGVLQPLLVARDDSTEGYVLIAGERRLQAARQAGLETVPALVRTASDQQYLEWALIENLQRSDLNPLEAAEGYRQLADAFGLSHEDVAKQIGKSRTAITNTLRLLKLSPASQQALSKGSISEGHARALLSLSGASAQSAALQTILRKGLNVRQTEELVRKLAGQKQTRPAPDKKSPEEKDIENQLRSALGTRVILKRGPKGGSITISFFSDEELNALIDRLTT